MNNGPTGKFEKIALTLPDVISGSRHPHSEDSVHVVKKTTTRKTVEYNWGDPLVQI